jgi:hypothetical protein
VPCQRDVRNSADLCLETAHNGKPCDPVTPPATEAGSSSSTHSESHDEDDEARGAELVAGGSTMEEKPILDGTRVETEQQLPCGSPGGLWEGGQYRASTRSLANLGLQGLPASVQEAAHAKTRQEQELHQLQTLLYERSTLRAQLGAAARQSAALQAEVEMLRNAVEEAERAADEAHEKAESAQRQQQSATRREQLLVQGARAERVANLLESVAEAAAASAARVSVISEQPGAGDSGAAAATCAPEAAEEGGAVKVEQQCFGEGTFDVQNRVAQPGAAHATRTTTWQRTSLALLSACLLLMLLLAGVSVTTLQRAPPVLPAIVHTAAVTGAREQAWNSTGSSTTPPPFIIDTNAQPQCTCSGELAPGMAAQNDSGVMNGNAPVAPPPPPPQQQQQQQQPQEAEMRHRNQQQQQQSSQGSLPSWSTRAREEHAAAAARAAQVAAARSRGPAAMRHSLIAPRPPAANGEVGAQGLSARSSLQAQRLAGLTRARNGGGMAGPEPPAPRVARGAGNEL